MSLSYALLGLLAVEPASGYELTKEFEGGLGRYAWQASHTSIYPELNRLAEGGLIEVTHEGVRGSRTYAVTPAGREALREWLLTPRSASRRVRDERVLRMFLLSALEPDDARQVLHRIAGHTAEEADRLRKICAADPDLSQTGREGFGRLAAEYGLRIYEAGHDWALWAINQLDKTRNPRSSAEPQGSE